MVITSHTVHGLSGSLILVRTCPPQGATGACFSWPLQLSPDSLAEAWQFLFSVRHLRVEAGVSQHHCRISLCRPRSPVDGGQQYDGCWRWSERAHHAAGWRVQHSRKSIAETRGRSDLALLIQRSPSRVVERYRALIAFQTRSKQLPEHFAAAPKASVVSLIGDKGEKVTSMPELAKLLVHWHYFPTHVFRGKVLVGNTAS